MENSRNTVYEAGKTGVNNVMRCDGDDDGDGATVKVCMHVPKYPVRADPEGKTCEVRSYGCERGCGCGVTSHNLTCVVSTWMRRLGVGGLGGMRVMRRKFGEYRCTSVGNLGGARDVCAGTLMVMAVMVGLVGLGREV